MLEIIQEINTWIWNILGLLVGIPVLTSIAFSLVCGLVLVLCNLISFRK